MRNANKKPLPILENITVIDASSDGQSVARTEEYVIFIKGAVPGDIVDVQVTRKKSKYREATAIAIKQKSDKRTEPICEHFGTCGGCKWQNMSYDWQCSPMSSAAAPGVRARPCRWARASPIFCRTASA